MFVVFFGRVRFTQSWVPEILIVMLGSRLIPDPSSEQAAELLGIGQRRPLVRAQVVARERDSRIRLAVDIETVVALDASERTA